LPDALKDGLISGLISEGHARALASIDDKQAMIDAYKILLKESGSVRRAEDLARRMKDKTGQKLTAAGHQVPKLVSEEIDEIANRLNQALGQKHSVKLVRTSRETRILIYLHGTLAETDPLLNKLVKAITG